MYGNYRETDIITKFDISQQTMKLTKCQVTQSCLTDRYTAEHDQCGPNMVGLGCMAMEKLT